MPRFATLSGLSARPELNTERVTLLNFDKKCGRWAVEVCGSEARLKVKPENLVMEDIEVVTDPSWPSPICGWDGTTDVSRARFSDDCHPLDCLKCLDALNGDSPQTLAATTACCVAIGHALQPPEGPRDKAALSQLADQLASADGMRIMTRAIQAGITTASIRAFGTLCLVAMLSMGALARKREEEAQALETLILTMQVNISERSVVINCLQAIICAFWIDERVQQTMGQENSFGRRAIKRSGPTSEEDLLATVVRILRHYWNGAPAAQAIGSTDTDAGIQKRCLRVFRGWLASPHHSTRPCCALTPSASCSRS